MGTTVLYKKSGKQLHYWEFWENDNGEITFHWGPVGELGETTDVLPKENDEEKKAYIQRHIQEKLHEGYIHIPLDDYETLIIEYSITGQWGTDEELAKRRELQKEMVEILGWRGLGYCDGGSTGAGTMEVCCLVIDFELAKRCVMSVLKDTKFADYASIYAEQGD